MTFELELIPTLLNNLYIPIVKPNGKPSIVKSKDAKEFVKYVQMKCLQQKKTNTRRCTFLYGYFNM
jgi:hypothetical protein